MKPLQRLLFRTISGIFDILFLLSLTYFYSNLAFGAACCGGGVTAPSLILGDHHAQFTTQAILGEVVVGNVDPGGYWRRPQDHASLKTIKLDGAILLSDLWQLGLSLPITQRTLTDRTLTGVGDAGMSLGFEYLPDWDYNPIRPKGLGFLQITLPTAKSKFESQMSGLDSFGNGFFSLGIGSVLSKTINNFDIFLSGDAHQGFSKSIKTQALSGCLSPGLGANLGWGFGFNYEQFRLGTSITWTVESPVQFRGEGRSFDTGLERFATGSIALSYFESLEWSTTLAYLDQTWFGSPLNTSLSKSIALQIQRHWLR